MSELPGEDRTRKIEYVSVASLDEAITSLKKNYGDNALAPIRAFEINPRIHPVNAGDLRQLTTFPFEFSVHEEKGKIRVTIGKEDHPSDLDEIGVPKTPLYTLIRIEKQVEMYLFPFLIFLRLIVWDQKLSKF